MLPNLGARQRADPRPARRGRRGVDALRPAGQGPRRVGALAARARSRRACCERPRARARRAARHAPSSSAARSRRTSRSGRTPARSRARCTARPAKQGLLGISFPEEVGGEGGDLLDSVDLQEAMFEAGASSGLMAGALHRRHRAAAHRGQRQRRPGRPVRPADAGRRDDRRRSRSPSPAAAPTSRGIRTTAVRDGDHYVVNGAKTFITCGVRADFVTTAVRTGGPGARRRLPARRREGHARLHRRPLAAQDGLALLRHRRAVVRRRAGAGRQPGRRGELRLRARSPSSSSSSGSRWRCTPTASPPARSTSTAAYCRDRETFGKPLISHQVVRHTAGRDAPPGRGRAHLHARGRRAGTSRASTSSPRPAWPSRPRSTARRTSATRPSSCTAARATCTGPRWSGTTATPGSCRSEEEPTEVLTDLAAKLLGYAS